MSEESDFLKSKLLFDYTTPEGDVIRVDFYTELLDYRKPPKQLDELPATFGFLGGVVAELMGRARELEDELEQWWAQQDDMMRSAAKTKLREQEIKRQIMSQEAWIKKRRNINKAWISYMRAKYLLDALSLKYGVLEAKKQGGERTGELYPLPAILQRAKRIARPGAKGKRMVRRVPKIAKKASKLYEEDEEEE